MLEVVLEWGHYFCSSLIDVIQQALKEITDGLVTTYCAFHGLHV